MNDASVAGLEADTLRFLRRFGLVAAAWTTALAALAPTVGRPAALWSGVALLWVWAAASQTVRRRRVWWAGWMAAALLAQFLGPLAATGGWSVVGGAPFVPISAAALTGRWRTAGATVAVFSAAALLGAAASGPRAVGSAAVTVLIFVFGGLALVWLVRLVRAGEAERDRLREQVVAAEAARARAVERAEAAASLHDSVLQSLAAVGQADDVEVARNHARAAAAELRMWIRGDGNGEATSFRQALERACQAVAAGRDVTVAGAGDRAVGRRERLLLDAAVEAVRNAVRHAPGPVRVYSEAGAEGLTVWVADRGAGFDPAAVPDDRLGVRESIVGRLRRAGGEATLRSGPGGSEWTLHLPPPDRPAGRVGAAE